MVRATEIGHGRGGRFKLFYAGIRRLMPRHQLHDQAFRWGLSRLSKYSLCPYTRRGRTIPPAQHVLLLTPEMSPFRSTSETRLRCRGKTHVSTWNVIRSSATFFREAIALVDLKRYDWKRFEPALDQMSIGARRYGRAFARKVQKISRLLACFSCRNTFCSPDHRVSVSQFSIHLTLEVRRPRNRISIRPISFQSHLTKVLNGGSGRCGISGGSPVLLLEMMQCAPMNSTSLVQRIPVILSDRPSQKLSPRRQRGTKAQSIRQKEENRRDAWSGSFDDAARE